MAGRRSGSSCWPAAFAWCRCLSPIHDSVSAPRSSNRTCGFPASGSPTESHVEGSRGCASKQLAELLDPEFSEDPLIRKPRGAALMSHLVSTPEKVANALSNVLIHGSISHEPGPVAEVVRPSPQNPVQMPRHLGPRLADSLAGAPSAPPSSPSPRSSLTASRRDTSGHPCGSSRVRRCSPGNRNSPRARPRFWSWSRSG